LATCELTDGFGFSLYQFLYDLVCADFTEIPDETRRDFCISILPECRKVSESLNYDGMDEWEAYDYFEEKMGEVISSQLME
jgi:hypothetical protein